MSSSSASRSAIAASFPRIVVAVRRILVACVGNVLHGDDGFGFAVAERLTGWQDGPAVVLVSSRDGADFGPLVERSGARGFAPTAELSGGRLVALL